MNPIPTSGTTIPLYAVPSVSVAPLPICGDCGCFHPYEGRCGTGAHYLITYGSVVVPCGTLIPNRGGQR